MLQLSSQYAQLRDGQLQCPLVPYFRRPLQQSQAGVAQAIVMSFVVFQLCCMGMFVWQMAQQLQ